MRAFLLLLATIVMTTASAPPPPPAWVMAAGEVLAARGRGDAAPFFASDMIVEENGVVIARDKAAWLSWRRTDPGTVDGRTLGYSESWPRHGSEGGELLVVETFDAVDRSALPPGMLVDPRMVTRSTLYSFGADHLIHAVRMQRTESFWMRP